MKTIWQTKKLGEVCEIVNGGTPDTKLAEVQIPLSPIPEQQRIVAKLEAIYRQKLADLEELKKPVLRKAFEGEL